MEFRLTPSLGIQLKVDEEWVQLVEEHKKGMAQTDKDKLKLLESLSGLLKESLPEGILEEHNEWGTQMYNGLLTTAQAVVGVTGVAIAAPFALAAGFVSEVSNLLIETLESAKVKT